MCRTPLVVTRCPRAHVLKQCSITTLLEVHSHPSSSPDQPSCAASVAERPTPATCAWPMPCTTMWAGSAATTRSSCPGFPTCSRNASQTVAGTLSSLMASATVATALTSSSAGRTSGCTRVAIGPNIFKFKSGFYFWARLQFQHPSLHPSYMQFIGMFVTTGVVLNNQRPLRASGVYVFIHVSLSISLSIYLSVYLSI